MADADPLAGGQGYVFRANRAGEPDDRLALKLLGDVDGDEEASIRERWSRLARRPHPHLVKPVELFRGPGLFQGEPPADEDSDLLYGVTEWLEGTTLRGAAPLVPRQVAIVVVDLAHALEHLHEECGLVHRDVHPGNVVIADDGRASLIDLGAARPASGPSTTTTVEGVLGFIPPERTQGRVDRRSDAWGLGMVTIHALIGHPLGDLSPRELEAELGRALPDVSSVRDLCALLMKMTAADPSVRPTDMVAWAEAVAALVGGRPPLRHRILPILVGASAAAVALAGVVALAMQRGGPAEPDAAPACTHELGAQDPSSGIAPETVAAVVPELDLAAAELEDPCGLGTMQPFGDGLYQELVDESGEWVVFGSAAGSVLLTSAEWASYGEIAGRQQSENAANFGGYPLSVDRSRPGLGTWIELSEGGVVVGPRSDTQSFWLPVQVREIWLSRGGVDGDLGLPMTNPYVADGDLRQDFAGGYMLLPAEVKLPLALVTSDMVLTEIDPDPARHLSGIDVRQSIVRQPTGSSWWVDAEGTRHWIADGGTYVCLGGEDALGANDVVGSALATIPLGEPASCGEDAT